MPEPLPGLIYLSDYQGDGEKYLDGLYILYLSDIVNAGLSYNGLPIRYQFRPKTNGKGFGFWHLISEGDTEEDRTPDPRRCERILWIPWIIKQVGKNPEIVWFESKRKNNTHIVLWYRSQGYAVILAIRDGYYLLKSAYSLAPKRAITFEKEWKAFWGKG